MTIRLRTCILAVAAVVLFCFTGCEDAASDKLPTEIADNLPKQKLLELDLNQYGQLLQITELGFNQIGLIEACGHQGILEAISETSDSMYYLYNMDTEETRFIGQLNNEIVSSAADVFMEDGSYITTGLFHDEDDKLYRRVLMLNEDGVHTLESTEIGQDEFPFIYLHKISETQFLATEIDPTESVVKKFDLNSNTITTLLSYSYSMENRSQKSGKVIRDALVYGDSMYALLLTLDSQECYEIEQYDLNGNHIATLDSSAAKRFFTVTPYGFNCIGGYLILRDVNANYGVYRIDENTLTEIIAPERELSVYLASIRSFYNSEGVRYIFLASRREKKDNLLFALDLNSSELKTIKIISSENYLYSFSMNTNGDLILEMKEDLLQKQGEHYYITSDTINNICSGVQY